MRKWAIVKQTNVMNDQKYKTRDKNNIFNCNGLFISTKQYSLAQGWKASRAILNPKPNQPIKQQINSVFKHIVSIFVHFIN